MKTCEELKSRGFDYLTKITAVDYLTHLEAVYILYNLSTKQQEIVKVRLENKDAKIDTIMHVFPAADWYEREVSEMFGIKIHGRKAKRLLLEEWDGSEAPLRKSFAWGAQYKKQDTEEK